MKRLLVSILGVILTVQLLLLFPFCKGVKAAILCVDKTGQSFDPNCTECYTKIMLAVSNAHDDDVIIVNNGVYEENIDYWGKAITIRSIDPDDPNVITTTSIIGTGSKIPVVYFGTGEENDSVLSGFTITNKGQIGNGTGIYCSNCAPTISNCTIKDNIAGISGAGIYCTVFSKPKLHNCSIIGNAADYGGGIFSDTNSAPSLSHCIVENNSAGTAGGGMYFLSSTPGILETTVKGNSAPNGAGIYLDSSSGVLITNSIIQLNNATASGGGIYLTSSTIEITESSMSSNSAQTGAGLYCDNSSQLTIDNSSLNYNNANTNGGALYCTSSSSVISKTAFEENRAVSSGGGIYANNSYLELTDVCAINGNTAPKGAGLYCDNTTTLTMRRGMINANTASNNGGGIFCNSSYLTIDSSDINGNYSSSSGGGIYINNSSSSLAIFNSILSRNIARDGAGLYLNSPNIAVSHCTIGTNTAHRNGGGIFCNTSSQEITITNSVLWENIPHQIYGGNPSVTYSDIQDGYTGDGNMDADPLFMDSEKGNYYLNPGSPCIDTGDPNSPDPNSPVAFDKEGIQRPHGGNGDAEAISDMGAYEYISTDSCTPRASFSVDKKTGYNPLTVLFDASFSGGSAYDDPNDPYDEYDPNAFVWDFGDGSTGTGINPEHTYENYGLYDVSLTITTKCGSHTLILHDYILVFSIEATKDVGAEHPYKSIQSAIDEAEDGENILVHDGTYNESIDFGKRLMIIRSENGPEWTIIDGSGASNVVTFRYGQHERLTQRLEGFTIRNGSEAGIYLSTSSPEIDNCIIKGNGKSGVYSYFSYPSITNCTIKDNKNSSNGGGIYAYYSLLLLSDTMVSHNTSVYDGGGIYCEKSSMVLDRCDINRNRSNRYGGGIYSTSSYAEILHSFIKDNSASSYGGGIYENSSLMFNIINSVISGNKGYYGGGIFSNSNRLKVVNATISNNISERGGGIYCNQNTKEIIIRNTIVWDNFYDQIHNGSKLTVTYSDIQGGFSGTGNINSDPMFIVSAVESFYMDTNSPCINAGDPNDSVTDDIRGIERPQGPGVDMGAYEYISPDYCTPQPSFTVDKTRGTAPLTVRFNASISVGKGSDDPNGPDGEDAPNEADLFLWDFGDGTSGIGRIIEHTYTEYGVYSVSLTITPWCGPDPSEPPDNMVIKVYDLICVKSSSPTLEVGEGSEFTYNSLQSAIDAAEDGEVILVHDGTYNEKIDFKGKRITLYSKNGPDITIIDPGDETGNIITFASNETIDSVLDGFTIQNSKSRGISCDRSSPLIKNCVIKNNASNGIYSYLTPPESSPVIKACVVIGNSTGIYCNFSSPDIMDCSIKENNDNGGIYCRRFFGEIMNCEVTGNSGYYGGGIRFESSSGDVRDCVISRNSASGYGGGIYFNDSTINLERCCINKNISNNRGGGIYCSWSSTSTLLTNCLITENVAQSEGGGIYTYYCKLKIVHSTFSRNIAANGGGIYSYSDSSRKTNIRNCILWNDFPNEIAGRTQYITVEYSDIMGGYPGDGNIDGDPSFVNSDGGDYYILPFSPCINVGDPNDSVPDDLYGIVRPQGPGVDLGAYESVSPSSCIPRPAVIVSTVSGTAPLTVSFDAHFSGGATCPYAKFLWEFGDGSTGNGKIIDHTYTGYGTYEATLRIIDPNDITQDPNASKTQEIYVVVGYPTKEVGPGGGYDYDSIQMAIDDADEGELILVHDGTYYERLNFKGKRLTLISKNGPESTILDGIANGSVVQFKNYEDRNSVIEGFTIQNGSGSRGGGIYCYLASPVIKNCILRGNYGKEHGGGIYCLGGSPRIIDCKIRYNSANSNGGGISSYSSQPEMTNCLLYKNRCGDKGGAIYHEDSDPLIINCTITENCAYNSGGGIQSDNSSPYVANSIFWADFPNEITKTGIVVPGVTYSIIEGYDGYDDPNLSNMDTDPLFIDSNREDYYVSKASPCIDSGCFDLGNQGSAPDHDIDGIIRPEGYSIDIGAYEYVPFGSSTPRAVFISDNISGTDTLEVYFDASRSGGLDSIDTDDPNSIKWNFGDGSIGSGIFVSHTYTDYGFYDVSLTIKTPDGSHSTLKRQDYIRIMSSVPTKEVGEQGYTFDSIQEAIDEAGDGEMILVHDGTYYENIDLKGKGIILVSENGPESTVIDGSGTGSVVRIVGYEGEDTVLDGFTIRNGSTSLSGGGIYIYFSSPVINNCVIKENFAEHGGGIFLISGTPHINNCLLSLNRSNTSGGGLRYAYSSPVLTGNIIERNQSGTGGGIAGYRSFFTKISNCIIRNNSATGSAGGIYEESKSSKIDKCTISSNISTSNGGGVYCKNYSGSIVNTIISMNRANNGGGLFTSNALLDIVNCTITQNLANSGSGIYCSSYSPPVKVKNSIVWDNFSQEIRQRSSNPQITYSCVRGEYPGEGNIKDDPVFTDPDTENYYLMGFSPCINASNDPNAPIDDREGITRIHSVDMGAYEYIPSISCNPRAVFRPYQTSGHTPFTVVFDASYSGGILETDPNNFLWDFGDGTTEKGISVSHTYTNHGAYTVSLTVSNSCGIPHTLLVPDCVKVKASNPTREVGTGTSYTYNSIQSAIDASEDWERIVVYSGTYNENIDFRGKRITLVSDAGKEATTIDGGKNGSVFTFGFNEDLSSILDGFTVYNGRNNNGGGGIRCYLASPFITNCSIKSNDNGGYYGGGVWCSWASPSITDCTIEKNISNGGGGIYFNYSLSKIARCIINDNTAYRYGGGIYSVNSSPNIINCLIFGNNIHYSHSTSYRGAGINLHNSFAGIPSNIMNCTFSGNNSNTSAGGIYLNNASPIITNSIFYFNSPDELYRESNSNPVISYSDIKGGYGDPNETHNIDADPLFADLEAYDYHLTPYSPCRDAGTDANAPSVPPDDLDNRERPSPEGGLYDMGAYEYPVIDPNDIFCYQDNDGDLYGDPNVFVQEFPCPDGYINRFGDCNDDDPNINPGAPELCDGINNDCDDKTDEGFNIGSSCDGEGECGIGIFECADLYTAICSTDPGGSEDQSSPEICDKKDNDCNGVIDDPNVLPHKTYYRDADKDDYGDFNDSQFACMQPEGYISDSSDCNDGVKAIHPGATDICGDSIDQDCDDRDCCIDSLDPEVIECFDPSSKIRLYGKGFDTETSVVLYGEGSEGIETEEIFIDQNVLDLILPSGMGEGTYDLHISNVSSQLCGDSILYEALTISNALCPFNLYLFKGWNLISLPMESEDMRRGKLFPEEIDTVFYYDSNSKIYEYVDANDNMESCIGYWVFAPEEKGYVMGDIPITHYSSDADPNSLPLIKGWNLIGALSGLTSISVSDGEINGVFEFKDGNDWGYDSVPGFTFDTDGYLQQGGGYWVYLAKTEGCNLYGSIVDLNTTGTNGIDDSSSGILRARSLTDGWAGHIKAHGTWEEGCATRAIVTIGLYTRQIEVPALPEPPCSTISLDLIDLADSRKKVKDIRSDDSEAQTWILLVENREDVDPNYCPLLTWDIPYDMNGLLVLRKGKSGTGEILVEDMNSVNSYRMKKADGNELSIVWMGYGKYYYDFDGDGYGVTDDFEWLPGPQDYYTALKDGDPDDTDPLIFPRILRIGTTEGYQGETDITLPLEIEDSLGVTGVDITLLYDSNTIIVKELVTTPLVQGFLTEYNIMEWEGKVNISIADPSGITSNTGIFANMIVDIAEEAQVGSFEPIGFEKAFINNENADFCGSITADGGIRITDNYPLGDLNKDKWLTSADAVIILKIAVGSIVPDSYQLEAGDLNKDGLINSADAILLLRAAVEKPTIFYIQPYSGMPGTTVNIIGLNFGASQGNSLVYFNNIPSQPVLWDDNEIITEVPSGLSQGTVEVTIETIGGTSNIFDFTVGENSGLRLRDAYYRLKNSPVSKTVTIPTSITAIPSEQVTVPVEVDDATDIAGIDLVLGFDYSSLKLVKAECTSLTPGFLLMMADRGNGEAIISLARASGITSGNGALATLTFEVSSAAKENDVIPLIIKNLGLYDEDARLINGVVSVNGEVIVSSPGACPEDNGAAVDYSPFYTYTYNLSNLSNFYYGYGQNQSLLYQNNMLPINPYYFNSNYAAHRSYSDFPSYTDYYPYRGYHGHSGSLKNRFKDLSALYPWWNNQERFYPYEYLLFSWSYYSGLD